MLPIFNSSCNESGKVSDPSYSDCTIRETSISREGMIGTTSLEGFVQIFNLSSEILQVASALLLLRTSTILQVLILIIVCNLNL
jgi:hypothetical protein